MSATSPIRIQYRSARHFRGRSAGFTLVELMTVLAITAILASLSFPALSGIQSAKFSDSASELSDFVKESQAVARASNSYVWIGFAQSGTDLTAVALQGTTGLSTDLTASPPQVRVAVRSLHLHNVVLDSSAKLPALAGSPTASLVTNVGQSQLGSASSGTFSYTIGSSTQTFSDVIGITPRGEAFLSSPNTMVHWLEIGVAPFPYNATNGQMPGGQAPVNYGELYMSGLTGDVNIVRP